MNSNVTAEDRLDFIVTTASDSTPRVMPFEAIRAIKHEITTLALLWNANSYRVDLPKRLFIINGGRGLRVHGFEDVKDIRILYYRRHTREVTSSKGNGDGKKIGQEIISYLLGWEGEVEGQTKQIMLHIGPDGREWYWRDHR